MQTLTWESVQLWAGTLPECRSYPHSVMETALGMTPLSLNSRNLAILVGTHALPVVGTLVFPVVDQKHRVRRQQRPETRHLGAQFG